MRYIIDKLSRTDNKEPCIILSRDKGQRRMITGTVEEPREVILRGEGSVNVSMDPDTTLSIRPAND